MRWDTSRGETRGAVVEEVTSKTRVKGHVAEASEDDPQSVVESDKSGKEAVHETDESKKV